MRRIPLAVALVPASLAVHLLLAACGGADTSTAQAGPGAGGSGGAASSTGSGAGGAGSTGTATGGVTTGSGSGGSLPFCGCAPKPPTVYEVACIKDPTTATIAELALPGATMASLARVVAIGHQTDPQLAVGSADYTATTLPVRVAEGHVMVMCETTGMPFKQTTTSVTFYVP